MPKSKPVLIKRIDLLVHPFYGVRHREYEQSKGSFLLRLWKKHVNEVRADPSRLLFVVPIGIKTTSKLEDKLQKELFEYAERKLGKRFGFFEERGIVNLPALKCGASQQSHFASVA